MSPTVALVTGPLPYTCRTVAPQSGAEMILLAATTGKAADVQEATRKMLVALIFENWRNSANARGSRRVRSAMQIEFEPDFRWDINTQTMRFYARHGIRRIRCAVSRPALEDRVRAHDLDPAGLERAFREHRQEIERKTSDKIRAGQFQAGGTILIRTCDLNP